MHRVVIFGNSGSGKSTLAMARSASLGCPLLDLDTIAWEAGAETPTRRSLEASRRDIHDFVHSGEIWVIEGCYADLLELALPHATEIVFLNPGTETCIENARQRPWEPHKYASPGSGTTNSGWMNSHTRRIEVSSTPFRAGNGSCNPTRGRILCGNRQVPNERYRNFPGGGGLLK